MILGAFAKPLLPRKSNKYYIFLCACACACGVCVWGVWVWVWVHERACRLTYPVCHAQALYCLRPLWRHHIFRHYLIYGTTFRKTLLNERCVLIFCTTFIWNVSHSQERSARYCHKCENVLSSYIVMSSVFYILYVSPFVFFCNIRLILVIICFIFRYAYFYASSFYGFYCFLLEYYLCR